MERYKRRERGREGGRDERKIAAASSPSDFLMDVECVSII